MGKKKNTGAGVPAPNTLYTSFGYASEETKGREDCLVVRYAADPDVLDSRSSLSGVKFHSPVLWQPAGNSDSNRYLSCRCTYRVQREFERMIDFLAIEDRHDRIVARFNALLDWKKK